MGCCDGVSLGLRLAVVLCWVDRCFGSWVLLGVFYLLHVTCINVCSYASELANILPWSACDGHWVALPARMLGHCGAASGQGLLCCDVLLACGVAMLVGCFSRCLVCELCRLKVIWVGFRQSLFCFVPWRCQAFDDFSV